MTSQRGSRCQNFEILTSPLAFSSQKTYQYQSLGQNYHFIVFYCVLGEFWALLGKIRDHDVTKGVKISKFWNFGTLIGFLIPKSVPMPIFKIKIIISTCFTEFWSILGHFGYNWGGVTSQRGSGFRHFQIPTSPLASSSKNTYPCQFLDLNNNSVMSYCVLRGFLIKTSQKTMWNKNDPLSSISCYRKNLKKLSDTFYMERIQNADLQGESLTFVFFETP